MKSELEKLDVDFTKMLKDFMMTILLISQIIVGFRAKAEESMETIISLLNQSKIDKKNEAELRERVKAAKEKMHHAADVLENITKRIGRKEQQNNDLAKAA